MKNIQAIAMSFGMLFFMPALQAAHDASHNSDRLDTVLAQQPEENKARYTYRNPKETLNFFNIKPGMTVVEGLPGGGWYSRILAAYLGKDGHLIGVDYPTNIWPVFSWASEEFVTKRKSWAQDWPGEVKGWGIKNSAKVSAYTLDSIPDSLAGSADAMLMIRALHNLNNFESKGKFLTNALQQAHKTLKTGGILGVVQHSTTDKKATGETGYLEKGNLIKSIEAQGFKLVAESDINANPKDNPKAGDIVWRLPPTYFTSKDDEKLKQQYQAIGESNRMTLKFIKK